MFALRGALVLVSTTALVAAVAITISGTPEATAANSASLEAESMTVTPSNAGSTVRDASAPGGLALSLRAVAMRRSRRARPWAANLRSRCTEERVRGWAEHLASAAMRRVVDRLHDAD